MSSRLTEIFEDENLITKIKNKLPYLFQLAELETSRAGKTGMEVGSLREKILIALLNRHSYYRTRSGRKTFWQANFY
jgi:hypothetical protein